MELDKIGILGEVPLGSQKGKIFIKQLNLHFIVVFALDENLGKQLLILFTMEGD